MKSLSSFLESPIVNINFAGFRATTHSLKERGWEFSASESVAYEYGYHRKIQLALKFQDISMVSCINLIDIGTMISNPTNYLSEFQIIGISFNGRSSFISRGPELEFGLDFMKSDFSAIDCTPQIKTIDLNSIDISKYGVFRKINDAANIFLPEKTVNELMEEILKKQKPIQDEIRNKRMKQKRLDGLFEYERNPNEEIKLQVVAI